jgi:hypothetical protein
MYAQTDITKESVTALVNARRREKNINCKIFTRKAYDSKEKNIPTKCYETLLTEIKKLYCNICKNENIIDPNIIAVDGTNNNTTNYDVMLNLCLFDITNKIPIEINYGGTENRNKEVNMLLDDIINNPHKFNNVILICDRLYFTYKLMHTLQVNKIPFIIRAKGNANNLDINTEIKYNKNSEEIFALRDNIRIIKFKDTYTKNVYDCHKKKTKRKKYKVSIENDCVLVTNLKDIQKYPDNEIHKLYKSRWEIETFFKLLKANMRFQFLKSKSEDDNRRLYICEIVIMYLLKIITYLYKKKNNIKDEQTKILGKGARKKNILYSISFNNSLMIDGIFNYILYDFIYGILTKNKLDTYCDIYI